jgi:hypothetical protein
MEEAHERPGPGATTLGPRSETHMQQPCPALLGGLMLVSVSVVHVLLMFRWLVCAFVCARAAGGLDVAGWGLDVRRTCIVDSCAQTDTDQTPRHSWHMPAG